MPKGTYFLHIRKYCKKKFKKKEAEMWNLKIINRKYKYSHLYMHLCNNFQDMNEDVFPQIMLNKPSLKVNTDIWRIKLHVHHVYERNKSIINGSWQFSPGDWANCFWGWQFLSSKWCDKVDGCNWCFFATFLKAEIRNSLIKLMR